MAFETTNEHQEPGQSPSELDAHLRTLRGKVLPRESPENQSSQYWSTRLVDVEPCHLPTLTKTGLPLENSENRTTEQRQLMVMEVEDLHGIEDLRCFSEPHGVSIANLFQLAWALVLSKYTGSEDVCFGYLTSGRDIEVDGVNTHAMVHPPVISTMVSRITLGSTTPIEQALQAVQNDSFDAFRHQIPLPDILRTLNLKGRRLFNTSLSYRQSVFQPQEESTPTLRGLTEYDAAVRIVVSGGKFSAQLQYSPDFICREAAAGLVACLFQAVNSLAKSPETTLGKVQIITQEDLLQLHAWNDEVPKQDTEKCIHEIVSSQRLARPDAIAVCAWDGNLSYRELEDAADSLASHLASNLGVGVDCKVALCLDRSRWAVISQLAILKAGGVVVSIDPKHPLQRVETILEDIGANVMSNYIGEPTGVFVCCQNIVEVGSYQLSGLTERRETLHPNVRPHNSAFIIYTSGSTGNPKGVVLTHASLVANFLSHGKAFGMSADTRSIQFASYSFVVSISDIWATIFHGGCVCIISEDERMNDLQAAIQSYRGTLSQLTPTVASLLDLSKLPSLQTLVLGGEAVKPSIIEEFVKEPTVNVLNGYGLSECSTYVTCGRPLRDISYAPVIGRPLVAAVWVVDEQDRVCPIGSIGELWVGGPLLAREYLNDEQKTAKSFVKDPLWARHIGLPSQRFYRTGDLVRQSRTGDIIYTGRRDTQVKMRGQRIEIGEIEHWVKKKLPDLREVVVGMLTTGKGAILAAAIESGPPSENQPADASARTLLLPMLEPQRQAFRTLQKALGDVIPSYMIPHLYLPVAKLPWSQSGKLYRKALWEDLQQSPSLSSYLLADEIKIPPFTDIERQLRDLWASTLNLPPPRVGANDDFFALGGDSLSAMRVVATARRSRSIILHSLTVTDLFRHRVLSELATAVVVEHTASGGAAGTTEKYKPFSALGETSIQGIQQAITPLLALPGIIIDVAPTTDLQAGCVVASLHKSRHSLGHLSLNGTGPCPVDRWRESCLRLVQTHEILRTAYVFHQGRLLQVVLESFCPFIAHYEVATRQDIDQFTKDLMRLDMHNPPCLGQPFTEFAIITSSTCSHHRILFRLSHGEYDAIGVSYLINTLRLIHERRPVPEYHSFASYVGNLVNQSKTDSLSYWHAVLDGYSMPTVRTQPGFTQQHDMRIVRFASFAVKATKKLPPGITTSIVIRAAWAQVLALHTRSSDVTFGQIVSGRNTGNPLEERAVGCCINIVPVRVPFNKYNAWSALNLLDYLLEQQISGLPHETLGFREILGECVSMSPSQYFTSRINHIGEQPWFPRSMGGVDYCVNFEMREGLGDGDASDVSITSVSDPESDSLRITLEYHDGSIVPEEARNLVETLRRAVSLLLHGSDSGTLDSIPALLVLTQDGEDGGACRG